MVNKYWRGIESAPEHQSKHWSGAGFPITDHRPSRLGAGGVRLAFIGHGEARHSPEQGHRRTALRTVSGRCSARVFCIPTTGNGDFSTSLASSLV